MNKIFSAIFSAAAIILTLCFGACADPGDSPEDPIIITTAAGLDAVRKDLTAHYKLDEDIDLSGYLNPDGAGWAPIGDNSTSDNNSRFTGSFDGDGHVIKGLWISQEGVSNAGLFGYTSGADIKNLGVVIDSVKGGVKGGLYTGGLVGYKTNGSIVNCHVSGDVNGSNYVGGLVGRQYVASGISLIENCYATGNVSGNNYVGGLVGQQYATSTGSNKLVNCYATGRVTAAGNIAGGLAGWQYAPSGDNVIESCYATGNVTATGNEAGGLLGRPEGLGNKIANSYRYQCATVKGANISANDPGSTHEGIHGGIVTITQLMAQETYKTTHTKWKFDPDGGTWHWDDRGFPKLKIGTENFPFDFDPGVPMISIITQPAPNTAVTQGGITGSLSVSASVTRGAELTYQWYSNTANNNTGGTPLKGAESAVFAIPATLAATGSPYYYFCEAGATDAKPVRFNVATVTVSHNGSDGNDDGNDGDDGGCSAGAGALALAFPVVIMTARRN